MVGNEIYNQHNLDKGITVFDLNNCVENENWLTQFSKNNYFGIIWSGSRMMTHLINNKVIKIPKNHFLFIAPGINQQFISQQNLGGYYIVFKQEFYSKSIEDNLKLENSTIFSSDLINVIENTISSTADFDSNYIKFFQSEFENELDLRLAHNLLERIILNGLMETFDFNRQFIQDDYDVVLGTKFKKLLQENVNDNKQVSFYIDQLFVTKRRLDKATLIVYNKTAKEMITDELIKNAKIMLANSKMSIKDVGLELNFLQETNFTAFFKKNTGISPTKFRQNTPS